MSAPTFQDLRRVNVARCNEVFHPLHSWSETDWACAAAGEMGELCNLIKKRRRGEPVHPTEVAKEIADVVIYLDLLAARMGIDVGQAVADKFNEVSIRRRSHIYFPSTYLPYTTCKQCVWHRVASDCVAWADDRPAPADCFKPKESPTP